MLTRRLLVLCLACIAAATVLLPAHTSPALADPVQTCHRSARTGNARLSIPATRRAVGVVAAGRQRRLHVAGQHVSVLAGWLGWFNETDGCVYALEKRRRLPVIRHGQDMLPTTELSGGSAALVTSPASWSGVLHRHPAKAEVSLPPSWRPALSRA